MCSAMQCSGEVSVEVGGMMAGGDDDGVQSVLGAIGCKVCVCL